MQYQDIESHFQNQTLPELLAKFQPSFDQIERYQQALSKGELTDPYSISEALNILTGEYMRVEFASNIINSCVTTREAILFHQKTQATPEFGKGPNATLIKKEVQAELKDWFRVNKIFRAYSKTSEKAVFSCMSMLKHTYKERTTQR